MFPGYLDLLARVDDKSLTKSEQLAEIFNATILMLEIACELVTCMTIRWYEAEIVKEEEPYRRKSRRIGDLLSKRFVAPSLGIHVQLAQVCTSMIDTRASGPLKRIKESLEKPVTLGPVGSLIDDLEELFDSIEDSSEKNSKARIVNRSATKQNLIEGIIPTFTPFRNDSAHFVDIGKIARQSRLEGRIDAEDWRLGFRSLASLLSPLLNQSFVLTEVGFIEQSGSIDSPGPDSESLKVKAVISKYSDGRVDQTEETLPLQQWRAKKRDSTTEVEIQDDQKVYRLDLWPFFIMRGRILCLYKKTTGKGLSYLSVSTNERFTIPTKRKFNHHLFNIDGGSEQPLFWTEVLPSVNPVNKVRANIPYRSDIVFVGRKKTIKRIYEEVIEIPNNNGIIYGSGGVGKTALMIELSHQLWNSSDEATVPFKNIIWVSAKTNYFDEVFGTIEEKQPQFSSLRDVLLDVLRFFEFEDVMEYDLGEAKALFEALLIENSILLVLDNLESLTRKDSEEIIRYFGTETKKVLKGSPGNFKVIITSRELVPSGFQQINLQGLETRDAIKLLMTLHQKYRDSSALTTRQMERIHEASHGIPLIIKHIIARLFEFGDSLEDALGALSGGDSQIVQFSFSEILRHVEKDLVCLKIIFLLDTLPYNPSTRQMAEFLSVSEVEVREKCPRLLNLECLERSNEGVQERYKLHAQVLPLLIGLKARHAEIRDALRRSIRNSGSYLPRMDYTADEGAAAERYEELMNDGQSVDAERFLKEQLLRFPHSALLRFCKAQHARKQRKWDEALDLLRYCNDSLAAQGLADPNVLSAIGETYMSYEIPQFEVAYPYFRQLIDRFRSEQKLMNVAAGFLIRMADYLRRKPEYDQLRHIENVSQAMAFAQEGLGLFDVAKGQDVDHGSDYLCAVAFLILNEHERALARIDRAINSLDRVSPLLKPYNNLRVEITQSRRPRFR
jgi:hypothetical protein